MLSMKWRLAAGWVLAVVLTTAVAWQIVAVADERVGARPVPPVQAAPTTTVELTEATVPALSIEPTLPPDPTLPRPGDDSTTTTSTAPETSSTTSGVSSPSTSTPSTSSTSSASSTTSARWSTKTIATNGGTVVVSYRVGEVILATAVPKPGFETEIDKSGPPVVEVEFKSSSLRVEIKAEWDDGRLQVDIDEELRED